MVKSLLDVNAGDEVTIVKYNRDNDIIVEYNGKKCTAIYNIFAGYYVDDIYGVIKEVSENDWQ